MCANNAGWRYWVSRFKDGGHMLPSHISLLLASMLLLHIETVAAEAAVVSSDSSIYMDNLLAEYEQSCLLAPKAPLYDGACYDVAQELTYQTGLNLSCFDGDIVGWHYMNFTPMACIEINRAQVAAWYAYNGRDWQPKIPAWRSQALSAQRWHEKLQQTQARWRAGGLKTELFQNEDGLWQIRVLPH